MSYPFHSVPRASSSKITCSELGFWGLDLSGDAFKIPINRAIDTENLIWDGAALKRRRGYRKISDCGEKINGLFFLDNRCVIHAGTKLYSREKNGELKLLFSEMNNAPSMGVVRKQSLEHRWCTLSISAGWRRERKTGRFLFINDGKNYLFFDGEELHSVADTNWGEHMRETLADGQAYSTYAAVPISVTGKTPEGNGGDSDPRGENCLSQFRCESFYVDDKKDYTEFILDTYHKRCNEGFPVEMQLRDSNGIWRSYSCISKDIILNYDDVRSKLQIDTPIRGGMDFSYDTGDGSIVNLGYGISKIANDGLDNLRITYAVLKDPPAALTGATVQGLYGTDASDNVLFLGGSTVSPGTDAFSARDDFFCFYATSVERLGNVDVAITGYCRLSDGRLAVLKNDSNESNVYFRSHTVAKVGITQSGDSYQVDAFPSKAGAAVEGCVSPHSVGIAGNEPIFLSPSGLYAVRSVSNELTNLDETVRRSRPIDSFLSAQIATNARSILWNGQYMILFGNNAMITDGRRDKNGMLRFLRWRFAHVMTALGKNGTDLYMGDSNGCVYTFGGSDTDAGEEMPAYWRCCLPEDASGRRQIARQIAAAVSSSADNRLSAVVFQELVPLKEVDFPLRRWDAPDGSMSVFNAFRWIELPIDAGTADRYEIRINFHSSRELWLWGLRFVYEKGRFVR